MVTKAMFGYQNFANSVSADNIPLRELPIQFKCYTLDYLIVCVKSFRYTEYEMKSKKRY